MPEINILPEELRNKIAAGEVIERPASVVKELVENSLDAEATEVQIEIRSAGRRLILVSDNGKGMDSIDAQRCIEPHATSKLASEDDLFRIQTLGFRGEALSSIASVSKMTLKTAPLDEAEGTVVEVEGGKVVKTGVIAHRGTTIEVRDLFYNTPARRKFLKSDRTETYHIIETVTEIALVNPDVSFHLKIDGTDTLILPRAEGLRERLFQIYGEEFMQGLLEASSPGVTIFASEEDNFRSRRASQYIFINKRPIRDGYLRNAIYRAYDEALPKDRHPIFFLYLSIPPEDVDFNVHPAKREVRFRKKEDVYLRVLNTLRRSLVKGRDMSETVPSGRGDVYPVGEDSEKRTFTMSAFPEKESTAEVRLFTGEEREPYLAPIKHLYLGDVFVAYTEGDGITIIDQHAAHERVRYENLRKGVDNIRISQYLFPRQVRLNRKEYMILLDHIENVRRMGIEIEDFGENTLLVRGVPDFLFNVDISAILSDVAEAIMENSSATDIESIRDGIAKRIACHSSVRGAEVLGAEELKALLRDLSQCEDPEHCPHGRPTRIHLSLDQLRRMFKRT